MGNVPRPWLRATTLRRSPLGVAMAAACCVALVAGVLARTTYADARTSFDDKTRDAALARLHQYIVDDAPFVWIAHDVGPRAMSPKVKNVVQPRSWFIDIATMTMD